MIEEYEELANKQIYPTKKEWFFKFGKHGVDYEKLLKYKKENLTSIDLRTVENSLYFNEDYIMPKLKEYYQTEKTVFESLNNFSEQFEEIMIFSEVEGTLEIEGIRTSKKKIDEVMRKDEGLNKKEQIIANMKNGMDFVIDHDITEENIHELYLILSFNSLSKEEMVENGYYRMNDVDIIGKYGEISDRGVDPAKLDEWMKGFVAFIQKSMLSLHPLTYLMPHIIHYYMLYLHPYYDFNGRMARILSYWYILKCPFIHDKLPVFSEAINYNSSTKSMYYHAIECAREDGNDMTFFFDYLFTVGLRFVNVYMKMDAISIKAKRTLNPLTTNELNTLKSILLYIKGGEYFTWEDVSGFDKTQYSKQYYFRLLNALVDKEVLTKTVKGKTYYFTFIA
jgi:Fic family protein